MPSVTMGRVANIKGAPLKLVFASGGDDVRPDVRIVYIEIADIDGLEIGIAETSEFPQNISCQLFLLGAIQGRLPLGYLQTKLAGGLFRSFSTVGGLLVAGYYSAACLRVPHPIANTVHPGCICRTCHGAARSLRWVVDIHGSVAGCVVGRWTIESEKHSLPNLYHGKILRLRLVSS